MLGPISVTSWAWVVTSAPEMSAVRELEEEGVWSSEQSTGWGNRSAASWLVEGGPSFVLPLIPRLPIAGELDEFITSCESFLWRSIVGVSSTLASMVIG